MSRLQWRLGRLSRKRSSSTEQSLLRRASSILAALICTSCAAVSAFGGTATLSWIAPTANTDGTALTNLTGYRASWRCGAGSGYPQSVAFPAPATQRVIDGLPDVGTCYFVVAAVNATGAVSAFSNEASKLMGVTPPGNPSAGPSISWAVSPMAITDTFTGTNGTGITAYSGNWAYTFGSGTQLQIQTNSVRTSADGVFAIAERTEATFPQDQYAQVTVAVATAGQPGGVALSCQGAGSGDCVIFGGDNDETFLATIIDGEFSVVHSIGGAISAGQVLRLTRSGNTYTPTINGSTTGAPAAAVIATFSNGKPGLFAINDSGSGSTARIDDFESTDASGGGVLRKNSLLRMFAGR